MPKFQLENPNDHLKLASNFVLTQSNMLILPYYNWVSEFMFEILFGG